MVERILMALDQDNADAVVDTFTETNDSVFTWDIPTIFPGLPVGNFTFVLSTPEVGTYTVLAADAGGASGGTLTDITDPNTDEVYTGHIFHESGDLTVTEAGEFEVMLVGPGGVGGSTAGWSSCGGGAGGDVVLATLQLVTGTYPIVIGETGLPQIDVAPTVGTATTGFGLTALPGGYGSGQTVAAPAEDFVTSIYDAVDGGGGRGGSGDASNLGASHPTNFTGGDGIDTGGVNGTAGGGGRGAGGNGQNGAGGAGGDGGPGIVSGIDGRLREYGRGGGGAVRSLSWLGGLPNGGGGSQSGARGGFGQNPGDGGGGAQGDGGSPARGGSAGRGMVIVRHKRAGTLTIPTDVGGVAIGQSGASGSIYDGFKLGGGDDFNGRPTRWHFGNITGDYAHSQPPNAWRGTNGRHDDMTYMTPEYRGTRSELPEPLNLDLVTVANSVATMTARPIGKRTDLENYMPGPNTPGHEGTDPSLVSGTLKTWPKYMVSAQSDWITECRVRVQGGIIRGYWPSFWQTTIFWPEGVEFDIMEIIKNPTTGVTRTKFVVHNEGSGGGQNFDELADPIIPVDRWVQIVAKKVGNTLFMYDDFDNEGVLFQRLSSNVDGVGQAFGAHDIRMDLAISDWWDGSNLDLRDYPAKVEFDWWRSWVPDTAARGATPVNYLPVVQTTPGGLWDAVVPDTATLFGADAGIEQYHAVADNFDCPTQQTERPRTPPGMSFDPVTRQITGTVPTINGGRGGLMITYAYDDGSPAARAVQLYEVAPAVQGLAPGWSYATGAAVNITIGFTDFHSGNLGPHTYSVTAPGLTVSGNGTTEATITGAMPASSVTVTIDCTNTVGQTTTVTRDIVVA